MTTAGTSSREVVVRARNLTKSYGSLNAVAGVSFDIHRGECFGFLGPNGAGKTTTMRMLYRATSVGGGELEVMGHDAATGHQDRALKRHLGVVPQQDSLDQELTARENLEVFCGFYGLRGKAARKRSDELLAFADLSARADTITQKLSGGMKRRLLVARGLICEPELVVLDEPTTGLDPRAREALWDKLAKLKAGGTTLLLTTHYMTEAERLCDRLVVMDEGKIVGEGAPQALIDEHVPGHVLEVLLPASEVPEALVPFIEGARRHERMGDRVLLFVDEGESMISEVARAVPDHQTLLRRPTLEDVFLTITGRGLDG